MCLNPCINLFFLLIIGQSCFTQDSLNTVIQQGMSKHKVPGAVIGIVKDDSLVNVVPFGFADVQNQSKVQSGTSFELGSLTKQFTAAAIVLLQQEGKLSIEDYIYKYFPECPEHWKEIKIKHLIWHTSGLPGMFPHDAFTEHSFTGYNKMSPNDLDLMMQLNTVSKENAIKSIITDSLDTKPGTHYNYSDVGYLVLGIIIDNVSGGYREYLQSHIFQPCGMSSTYLLDQERVVPNQAR